MATSLYLDAWFSRDSVPFSWMMPGAKLSSGWRAAYNPARRRALVIMG